MEFFMFIGISRQSFDKLVEICRPLIDSTPLCQDKGKVDGRMRMRRLYGARGVLAMTLKYLTSIAEAKDIYIQLGVGLSVFQRSMELGMVAIILNMLHPKMRVYWDRSERGLKEMARLASSFLDLPGVVGMIDGKKLPSLHPSN